MEDLVYGGSPKFPQIRLRDLVRQEERRLVLPWFGGVGMQLSGFKLHEIYQSPARQLEVANILDEAFGADFVNIMDDGIIISETLGMPLLKPDYDFPSVWEPLIKTGRDLARLALPDPYRDGRMPLELLAVKLLAESTAKPLVFSLEGPFTLAGQIMGVPDLARAIIREPELVKELLDFTRAAVLGYGRAVAAAGADLISVAEPTSIILSPRQFEALVWPGLHQIYAGLDCWKGLHICGDTSHLLPLMLEAGMDALSLDQLMNLPAIAPDIPEELVLFGNIDPITVMLDASPEEVRAETSRLLAEMKDYPNFLMSTGCDLAVATPLENLRAFMETGRLPRSAWGVSGPRGNLRGIPDMPMEDGSTDSGPAPAPGQANQSGILLKIRSAVANFDREACVRWCGEVIRTGGPAQEAIDRGLAVGMTEAGRYFQQGIYYVPELIMAADALEAGLKVLRPHLPTAAEKGRGRIVLGTVQGDLHEIGKNLVATMFTAAGWEVFDLGVDVAVSGFRQACREHQPHLVGLSALMSTTMAGLPEYIRLLKEDRPELLIMVGGAPLTPGKATLFGADGYGRDSAQAVRVGEGLLQRSLSAAAPGSER